MAEKPTKNPVGRVVLCPQCEAPLPMDARLCPQCGVDLALLSLLGEKAYLEGVPKYTPIDTTPAWLVPRIGEFLIERSVISKEQLDKALSQQAENAEQGKQVLLGQTLIEMGFIDRDTLDQALTEQIVDLHAAVQESNRTLQHRVHQRTRELRHALQRLTEINQVKANLISNISHELRTPLAHLKGYVELLADGELGALSAEQSDAIGVMRRATDRLNRLIEDLIEFSTASREGLTLNLHPMSAPDIVESILQKSHDKAEKAGVKLVTQVGSNLPAVRADVERLTWAIYQLIDNGIKFTPAGGSVSLRVQASDTGIQFEIEDTGIGIPEDRIEEIFEPFHQLDGSPTRRYGGTGLGLSLVKLILEAHGSSLEVHSEEGHGTRFRFQLAQNSDQ
ncbi:MAG: ATP-binding protein [Anaerolineales bacterium]